MTYSPGDVFATAADDVLAALGELCTYSGSAGTVPGARIQIVEEPALFGTEVQAHERRWTATILRADVAEPKPGDTITDNNGQGWTLDAQQFTDEWSETWSIAKQ